LNLRPPVSKTGTLRKLSYTQIFFGLPGEIRTPDPLDPNQMR